MALDEAGEDGGQEGGGEILRAAEMDLAGGERPGDALGRLFDQGDHLARDGQQRLALARQHHAAAVARQQAPAEGFLQPAQLQRHRRLGAAQTLGGAGEGPRLGQQQEGAQQGGVDVGGAAGHAPA